MFTRFKTWVKDKWQKLKRNFRYLFGIGIASAAGLTGVDAVQFTERPIPTRELTVASEMVRLEQRGNVVEATMPWKGEKGLKVKYDLGEPTLKERLADKRDKEVVAEKVPFNESEGFKIDILLKEKPATNTFCYDLEGWEDYDFFYQPPLTEQEIANGKSQPDEINGSYAVYHKVLQNHVVGKTNYETGMFGYIPFPYVWEVGKDKEKIRAEDLSYNTGRLCVIVPQDFLNKADYTNGVRVDPTFGYTTVGATSLTVENFIECANAAPAESGTVGSITSFISESTGASSTIKSALYTTGGTLQSPQGNEVIAPRLLSAWATSTVTGTLSITSQSYYVCVWGMATAGSEIIVLGNSGFSSQAYKSIAYGSWPNPLSPSSGTYKPSVYATYSPSAPPASAPAQSEFWFE